MKDKSIILTKQKIFINKVEIENFKNIKKYCVELNKNLILVQSKDVHSYSNYSLGKTNFLNAILWCFVKDSIYSTNVNIEALNDLKNKILNEFNVSVKITYVTKTGQSFNAKRIVTYSYKKINSNSLIKDNYYVTQKFLLNEKEYSFGEYLDITKNLIIPDLIDNLEHNNLINYKSSVEEHLYNLNGNQIFLTSYDNHLEKPVLGNILNELNKDFQIITVNDI